MSGEQADLVALVVAIVLLGDVRGKPIEYATGPLSDRRAKKALGLDGFHQSSVCAAIKQAIKRRLIFMVPTGTVKGYMGERVKHYPVVALHIGQPAE